MPTVEKTVVEVTCDSCDAPAQDSTGEQPEHFDSLEEAIATLTTLGFDWEYFPATDRWRCDRCRAVEACHAAGGHLWSNWRGDIKYCARWRHCIRTFDFGRCPGFEEHSTETAKLTEGAGL